METTRTEGGDDVRRAAETIVGIEFYPGTELMTDGES